MMGKKSLPAPPISAFPNFIISTFGHRPPRPRYGFIQIPLMVVSIGLRATAVVFRGVGSVGGRLASRFLTPRALGRVAGKVGRGAGRVGAFAARRAGVSLGSAVNSNRLTRDRFFEQDVASISESLEQKLRRDEGLDLGGVANDIKPHLREALNRAARRIAALHDENRFSSDQDMAIFSEEIAAAGARAQAAVQNRIDADLQTA